jgi:hypothetical protein
MRSAPDGAAAIRKMVLRGRGEAHPLATSDWSARMTWVRRGAGRSSDAATRFADPLDNRREAVGKPLFIGVEINNEVGRADLAEAQKRVDQSGRLPMEGVASRRPTRDSASGTVRRARPRLPFQFVATATRATSLRK